MRPDHLACSRDVSHRFDAERLATTCPHDGAPLLVRYPPIALDRAVVAARPSSMWRYREALPLDDGEEPVTLAEGGTPLLRAGRLEAMLGLDVPLYVKDESRNPTASFKSRGMSVAVTRAKKLGAPSLVAPSAGNAGGALAAYGARAGLPVTVFLPRDTPAILIEECRTYGATVELVAGLIDDAGKLANAHAAETGAFNVATLREPYRIEGKKTMGYELVEELGDVPGAIVYPTGGGTGLVGMWKAFEELQEAGWLGTQRPQMISVQAAGCAPIVRAFESGADHAERWSDAHTAAWGLRVPAAIGDRLMLDAIRASGGCALAVSEEAMDDDMLVMRKSEGIDACEEGGAALAALRQLVARGTRFNGPVVLFNTGSALKYGPRIAKS
ncbi:MAG: threonine synthase [Candidatus Eremiobacteraeota bacterium]|nr:threonine synthase [Candidatus Eremiobacteraeota bacterium]